MSDPEVDRLMDVMRAAIDAEVTAIGEEVAEDVRRAVSVPVEYDGARVIRSLPGEPPRLETGRLRASVRAVVETGDRFGVDVVADAPYANALEYGHGRTAPRPFLAPAAERAAKTFDARVEAAANRAVTRAQR